jgi:scyllo-inositol 2-dehydrogenase (NADP+)
MPVRRERPVSVALLGYGLGGRVFHAPLIEATPGLSLDAIVTSDAGRAAQARATHPRAHIYPTVEAAWTGGHDLAVISTANATHVPYARAALAAGLDVVLDKPIAPTADAARELAALAEAHGRRLIPFQNRRWDSDFRTVRAVAADGRIGRVHRFESRIERMRLVPKPGWKASTDPADMGGLLYDLGAHVVDQALILMGPVVTVASSVRSVRFPEAPDDDVVALLTHQSGAVSILVASQAGAFAAPRMTLLGTRGGLRIDASDTQEQVLAAGGDPAAPDWGIEPASSAAVLREYDDEGRSADSTVPLLPGAWPQFYRGVATALADESADPVAVADVIENLRVLDAARVAAETGTVVSLDPPAGHRAVSTS